MTQQLGDKYQLIRRLARGGMGELYLARDLVFDRLVAVKTVLPQLALEGDFTDRLFDEARLAAGLSHPNIVSIHEIGQSEGRYYVAMEYIQGDNLVALLDASDDEPPLEIVISIVHEAAVALDHAHTATTPDGRPLRIVHRDVSPQNIMVRTDGVVKVVDFGTAFADVRRAETRSGIVWGKMLYVSPEQLKGDRELDGRSDQFSLGVVLWELLTNRSLFFDHDQPRIPYKILTDPIVPPSTYATGIPKELDAVVLRMLERNREKRFPRCLDVAEALAAVATETGLRASQRTIARLVEERLGARIRRRTQDLPPHEESLRRDTPPPEFMRHIGSTADSIMTAPHPWERFAITGAGAALMVIAVWAGFAFVTATGDAPKSPVSKPASNVAVDESSGEQVHEYQQRPQEVAGSAAVPANDPSIQTTDPQPAQPASPQPDETTASPSSEPQAALETPESAPPLRVRLRSTARPGVVRNRRKIKTRRLVDQGTGYLTLRTVPWTRVTIDGRPWGSTPLYKVEIKAGDHVLELENADSDIKRRHLFSVKPRRTTKIILDLTAEK